MLSFARSLPWAAVAVQSRLPVGRGPVRLESAGGPTDAELARRVARGDGWAEEAFYRRHVEQVLGLAQRLLRNFADAEDVAQDTFATAFQIWDQLRDPERARPWLMQIAVRQVQRKFRKRRVLRLLGLDRNIEDLPLEALAREDASAEVRSELALLDSALSSLAIDVRMAWMLRHIEGLPLDEVAEQCQCSLATVKRRIASAHRVVSSQVELEEAGDD